MDCKRSRVANSRYREQRLDVPLSRGLSTKLLLLTIVFVLFAEVLIFVPSIANFRLRWLEERLMAAAAVSSLLVEVDPTDLTRVAAGQCPDVDRRQGDCRA